MADYQSLTSGPTPPSTGSANATSTAGWSGSAGVNDPYSGAYAQPAPAPAQQQQQQQQQQQVNPYANLPQFSYDLNGVNPTADLQYNAFKRGEGFDQSQARAAAAYQKTLLQQQLTTQMPRIAQQEQLGLTNAGESAANRGAASSSSLLQSQNQVGAQAAAQRQDLQMGVANQGAQIDFNLANTLGQLTNQTAEQEMAARQRIVDQNNQAIAYKLALAQLGY